MALKQHCDFCDAVIPDDQEWVYIVPKTDYHVRDWRYGRDVPMACMSCLATSIFGDHLAEVMEKIKQETAMALASSRQRGVEIQPTR